ncbi:MAG: Tol-Pal system protein TolB, partial [Chromatiales bacterium]|nr:Tol-Pal system protein TolB [Chromatiales bacterium]
MTKVFTSLLFFIVMGVIASFQPAHAELRIEITRGISAAVPIAVVPFGYTGPGAEPFDVAGVVAADLASSGRFDPMERKDMLEMPSSGAEVDFQDWRLLKAQVLVVGAFLP